MQGVAVHMVAIRRGIKSERVTLHGLRLRNVFRLISTHQATLCDV